MEIDVDYFITLVRDRPILWDKTNPDYKEKFLKTDAWKNVCESLFPNFQELDNQEKTKLSKDVVKKWRGIKDNFIKYEKKIEDFKAGLESKKVKRYHLYDQLLFLKKDEQTDSKNNAVGDEEPNSASASEEHETHRAPILCYQLAPRKRAIDETEDSFVNTHFQQPSLQVESRHMSFFKGILPSVEKLNDDQTLIFQSRVLQILTDLQQPHCERCVIIKHEQLD